MNPILRNILAVIVGFVIGSVINMGIITLNGSLLPLPEGIDILSSEGMKSLPFKYFIGPFLAHAFFNGWNCGG